ncbi:charged multivesicular body protein 3 [Sporothrix brasiliensis 5110]|uniref:Charged multivesicular body protein 3 n=1 Tax=Sporothrix brasiliensis 5110 TaxID=1398154 RepID=A0A0C2JE33_9PEZI|nr:charged multivesicular body protein 3 [Sporothrix brasiliensis 5110]KIH95192.1 charged multivesicular body protein 3 [Sporothrix brasiliensis 5110]
MDNIRALFQKPDPQAQLRKCNTLLRSNMRKIDRDIANAKRAEITTKNLIIQADRRAQRDPSRAKQAQREVRDFARELVRARRTSARLVTGRAQLNSVQMQVSEAFAMRKIEGSIRASVGVMRDVNQLIRLPELAGTMQELSVELMKAGIVEEMVNETLPEDDAALFEDEDVAEADSEVDRVLSEILKDRMAATGPVLPSTPVGTTPVPAAAAEPAVPVARSKVAIAEGGPNGDEDEEDEEDTEAMMAQMRNRLESLRS